MKHTLLFGFIYLLLSVIAHGQDLSTSGGVLINYNTTIHAKPNKLVSEATYVLEVRKSAYRWLGEISIPQYGTEKIDHIQAEITDVSGHTIRKLKKSEITLCSAVEGDELFSDSYTYLFDLKHHSYPYRIKYSYRRTVNQFISLARWFPVSRYDIPTDHAELNIYTSPDYPLHVKADTVFDYQVEQVDGEVKRSWSIDGLRAISRETFAPPLMETLPSVYVVPENFNYIQSGSTTSWQAYGEWQCHVLEGLNDLPEAEKNKVIEIIGAATDPHVVISRLYRYLQQNHRYIYVGIASGGLEPYPAAHVVANRYGDCKGLTNYMKALLEVAGIPAYYTTIYAGDNPVRVDPGFPSHQSNHVILAVPINEDTVWLENTSNCAPYNHLGTFTQGRYALLHKPGHSELVRTPQLSIAAVTQVRTFDFSFTNEKTSCNLTWEAKGKAFEDLNELHSNYSTKDQSEYIRAALPFTAFDMDGWQVASINIADRSITTHIAVSLAGWYKHLGNAMAIPIVPLVFTDLERPAKRTLPVRINYPLSTIDTIHYATATLGTTVKIPEPIRLQSLFGSYELISSLAEDTVTVVRTFTLFRGDYPLDKYPSFYDFISAIREAEHRSLTLVNIENE